MHDQHRDADSLRADQDTGSIEICLCTGKFHDSTLISKPAIRSCLVSDKAVVQSMRPNQQGGPMALSECRSFARHARARRTTYCQWYVRCKLICPSLPPPEPTARMSTCRADVKQAPGKTASLVLCRTGCCPLSAPSAVAELPFRVLFAALSSVQVRTAAIGMGKEHIGPLL